MVKRKATKKWRHVLAIKEREVEDLYMKHTGVIRGVCVDLKFKIEGNAKSRTALKVEG
jgi:hypothetical protein